MSEIEKDDQPDQPSASQELSVEELGNLSGGKHMDPPPPPPPTVGGGGGYIYDSDTGKKHVL